MLLNLQGWKSKMATTSIWAVKDNLDRVLNYASNPLKTKETDSGYEYEGLGNVIDYAVNDDKTERQLYVSGLNCHPSTVLQQMEQTKRNSHKEDGVLAFHAYQSFLPGEVTAETAHQIGLELAHQMWGDDFEVLVCTHTDKKHFHNHFVINSVSWTTYKRFLNKHSDYDRMRRLSDALCEKYRLNVITDPKKGVHYSEWQAKKQKKPTRRTLIEDDLERAIASSRTFTQFLQYLKSIGYDVKTNVKHIAVKPPGAPRFFRLYKVRNDGTYSEENIKKRIIEQDLYFEKRTRIKSKYQYHGNIKKAKKIKGIKALYFHYMYRMGIIPKNVPSRRKVHFIFKEDLRYMDRITEETTFLCKKKINTIEDLENYESKMSNKIEKPVQHFVDGGYDAFVECNKEIVFQLLKEIIELKSIVLPLLLLCDFYQKDFDEEWATISKEVDRNYLKEQIAYIPFTESEDYLDLNITDVLVYKDKIEKIPVGLMKYFNNLKEVYDDLKEKQSFNQSLLEVERIILLMEKDYQLYPFESFVSELKIHYSKEYYILMKLLEIVMKDCQEAKLGRETVKLTLSLMMNQKLRLKIFGF